MLAEVLSDKSHQLLSPAVDGLTRFLRKTVFEHISWIINSSVTYLFYQLLLEFSVVRVKAESFLFIYSFQQRS